MNESKVLKIISTTICPHCSQPIVVSQKMTSPWVDWILKESDIEKAKKTVISMVEKSTTITEEEKKSLLKWLTSDDTLFGPEDIDIVLNQILNKKNESTSEKNKNK